MLYLAYQLQSDLMEPVRAMARLAALGLRQPLFGIPGLPDLADTAVGRNLAAMYEVVADTTLTHERPPYGIASTRVSGTDGRERDIGIREEAALTTPFGTLLHFAKDVELVQPRVLVVAPLSGHFATLLRGTVETLLPDNDVYITDWHNARDVSLEHGRFGFDEYVEHLIQFLARMGPGAHIVAVCQPCVAALAATAVMGEGGHDCTPRSITLMAGPVDARINPTKVNELATSKPIEWFEQNLLSPVPRRYAGAGRLVYPGFVQLTAFMSMNLERHISAHMNLVEHTALGEKDPEERDKARASREFYDEYFAVLDLPAEFYIETVKSVFQDCDLARGTLTYQGRPVDPRAIRKTALLTVEGEKDDICSLGQTMAAQELCASLRPYRKKHHMQAGVGHYGVFSGRRWNNQIYPILRNVILSSD